MTNELTGAPVAGIAQSGFSGLGAVVGLFDANGNLVSSSATDQDGRFISNRGLPTGQYFAKTFTRGVTIDEVYGGESCLGDLCNVLSGTPISITAGNITSGIDFALAVGGTINATILSASTGVPVAATMSVYTAAGQVVSTSLIPTAGISRRPRVAARQLFRGDDRHSEHAPAAVQRRAATSCTRCTTTSLPARMSGHHGHADRAGRQTPRFPITFALDRALGRIMGYVTDAATGALLSGVPVEIYSAGWHAGHHGHQPIGE